MASKDTKPVKRCDGKGTWCLSLDRVFTEENTKGINPVRITSAVTGKSQIIGVAYRTSVRPSKKDPGVMFNFCPFCGADLKALLKLMELIRG